MPSPGGLLRRGLSLLSKRVQEPIRHAAWRTEAHLSKKLHSQLRWLEHTKSDERVRRLMDYPELAGSPWKGLIAITYGIVRKYQPRIVVELGTHSGCSAFTMGLGLKDLNQGGKLYAVDTWKGEEHAGLYGEEVFERFLERRSELGLQDVIVPLRMLFDEAIDKVGRPIDLLHIDGLHTLEVVTHDFETYKPLVRSGGLILFHDVNTHFDDMRRFWAGISSQYSSYMVHYSHGLGVIQV